MKIIQKFLFLISLFSVISAQPTSTVKHPEWVKDAVIYEVNLRQYTPGGTISEFKEHLPRLKELGVDILWFMPIHPIGEVNRKGTMGSYYAVKDYTGLGAEYGTKEEFKGLVNEIHKQGMYVILDWVANHTAWDHPWTSSNSEFYIKNDRGDFVPPVPDWHDVIKLDYSNSNLRTEMIKAFEYWVNDFNVDGFRCDVAGMVPLDFWVDARNQLAKSKEIFWLAEWDTPEMQKDAFNMTYGGENYRIGTRIFKGENTAFDLFKSIGREQTEFHPEAIIMQFTTNHDENTWNGATHETIRGAEEVFTALTYLIPGMPLIYSGQEAGLDKRLSFFDKDEIIWKQAPMADFFKKLNSLKKSNSALNIGEVGAKLVTELSEDQSTLFIIRKRGEKQVVGIFNLSAKQSNNSFNHKELQGTYTDFTSGNKEVFQKKINSSLPPWGYKILSK